MNTHMNTPSHTAGTGRHKQRLQRQSLSHKPGESIRPTDAFKNQSALGSNSPWCANTCLVLVVFKYSNVLLQAYIQPPFPSWYDIHFKMYCSQKGRNCSDKALLVEIRMWSQMKRHLFRSPLWNDSDHSCVYILVIHPFALAIFSQMTVLNLSLWLLLILYSQKSTRFLRCFHLALFIIPFNLLWPLTCYSIHCVDVHPFSYENRFSFPFFLPQFSVPSHWSESCT